MRNASAAGPESALSDRFGLVIAALKVLGVTTAAAYILMFLVVVTIRLSYPYDLEWMEGAMVDHVGRALAGAALYVPPSLDFTTFLYTPLYYYVSAAFAMVLGTGYLPLRLVSIAASIGSLVLVFLMVRRRTGGLFHGFLAAGLHAATYDLSGAWLDIARVDSLYLLLLLATGFTLRYHRSRTGLVAAGILAFFAFLTKQSAMVAFVPLAVYAVLDHGKTGGIFIGVTLVLVGLSTVAMNLATDGWYSYYVFELPASHAPETHAWYRFWSKDIFASLPIASFLGAWYVLCQFLQKEKRDGFFHLLFSMGLVGAAWSCRVHSGAWENSLITAHAACAILFGLGLHAVTTSASRRGRPALIALVLLGSMIQFVPTIYDPAKRLPTARDRRAGDGFVDNLRRLEGEVLVLPTAHLPTLAGKKSHAHVMALYDVIRGPTRVAEDLIDNLKRVIVQQRFAAIIYFHPCPGIGQIMISDHYDGGVSLFNDDAFQPRTGPLYRPQYIFVRKKRAM